MTLGTWLFTKMRGERVGTDAEGNLYYQDKRAIAGRRRKRWVMYNGVVEASRVPPEWHGWLHYTTDVVPPAARRARPGKRITRPTPPAPTRPIVRRATRSSSATSPSRPMRRGVRAEMRQH